MQPGSEEVTTVLEAALPDDLLYTPEGCWVRLESGTAVVGLMRRVFDDLGAAVCVDVPSPSAAVEAGDRLAIVECTCRRIEVRSPVSGRILEANWTLAIHPEHMNADPYGSAWIARLTLDDLFEVGSLLGADDLRRLERGSG